MNYHLLVERDEAGTRQWRVIVWRDGAGWSIVPDLPVFMVQDEARAEAIRLDALESEMTS